MRDAYDAGHLWVLEDGDETVGTVSLTKDTPAGWTEEEQHVSALYVYKVVCVQVGGGAQR